MPAYESTAKTIGRTEMHLVWSANLYTAEAATEWNIWEMQSKQQ